MKTLYIDLFKEMDTYIFMAVSEYRKFLDSLTPEQLTAYRKEQRESAKRQYQKTKKQTQLK